MRKQLLVCMVLGLGLWTAACNDRQHVEDVATTPPVQAGEFHNEVLTAFNERAPLTSVPGMTWDQWLETTLSSMEAVSAAHDIPFDRDQTTQAVTKLASAFHSLEEITGIDPGMLHESKTPEADLPKLLAQLEAWKLVDSTTTEALSDFTPATAALRARTTTDPALREILEIGAASGEFWSHLGKEHAGPSISPPDDESPCKHCNLGSVLADILGGVIGRIICGNDPLCPMQTAAAASMIYNMATGYCNDHPCNWQSWMPPFVLP
jgi:hypothetical protein